MPHARRETGIASRRYPRSPPPQNFNDPKALHLDPPRRFLNTRVVALRQHDPPVRPPRPGKHAVQETHFANFFFRASWTAGWTRAETSPPNRATSRTKLELR